MNQPEAAPYRCLPTSHFAAAAAAARGSSAHTCSPPLVVCILMVGPCIFSSTQTRGRLSSIEAPLTLAYCLPWALQVELLAGRRLLKDDIFLEGPTKAWLLSTIPSSSHSSFQTHFSSLYSSSIQAHTPSTQLSPNTFHQHAIHYLFCCRRRCPRRYRLRRPNRC